jgi:hypothetical protein
VYVNLKELERSQNQLVDRDLIKEFVLHALNRVNDRDVAEFVEDEFEDGLRKGYWFFLFDSFDEVPDILSSVETDTTIQAYAMAISDFLGGMNRCRGVLASRAFRGPRQLGWPRFRILPLTCVQRTTLIRRVGLRYAVSRELSQQLAAAGDDVKLMSANPMFLALLAERAKSGRPFPSNVRDVYETYIDTRLERDEDRLMRRFGLGAAEVRSGAEQVAFAMAADEGLGLSPSRAALADSLKKLHLGMSYDLDVLLDALEFIKLARSEALSQTGRGKTFTYAHRRFQEYFATSVVLREPTRVPPRPLVSDARWREAVVVLCQTQPRSVLEPVLRETENILSTSSAYSGSDSQSQDLVPQFEWPDGCLHVLGILQDGFAGHLDDVPDPIRDKAGSLLSEAVKTGSLADKRWALEVAGVVPPTVLTDLLRIAFEQRGQWLEDAAYRQAALLVDMPQDLEYFIRVSIARQWWDGSLRERQQSTRAYLRRLPASLRFIKGS